MSKSPAMINRANRIAYKQLVCHFKNKEYSTSIPTKPELNVMNFLDAFSESNFEGNYKYYDIEMYKDNEYLPYDYVLQEDNFEPTYKLQFSELNKQNFLEKSKLDSTARWYLTYGLDHKGNVTEHTKNFFSYLIREFPELRVSDQDVKNNLEIQNLVNNDEAKIAQEENTKKFKNQWLYNKNCVSLITPLNLQSWDMFYYKNLLTQLFSQFNKINKKSVLDVDHSIKGLHTREVTSDFVIKSQNNKFRIPITIVDNIDEVKIFDQVRTTLYDYYFPKLYPFFAYEFVDPNDYDSETIAKADVVNRKISNYLN
jgi:hypothetical protein